MWDQLTTFWSLDRAEKHYSLKEQPLNMPLGSQNPYEKGPIKYLRMRPKMNLQRILGKDLGLFC